MGVVGLAQLEHLELLAQPVRLKLGRAGRTLKHAQLVRGARQPFLERRVVRTRRLEFRLQLLLARRGRDRGRRRDPTLLTHAIERPACFRELSCGCAGGLCIGRGLSGRGILRLGAVRLAQ